MQVQPYLFYAGTEEAIEFYRTALGAEVETLLRMKDNPGSRPPNMPPGAEDKVMHASVRIGGGVVMMSDGECQGQPRFEGFGLSLPAADARTAQRYFDALSQGGQVRMPLTKTFFAESFGMLADRFGVLWMIIFENSR